MSPDSVALSEKWNEFEVNITVACAVRTGKTVALSCAHGARYGLMACDSAEQCNGKTEGKVQEPNSA